VAGDISRSFPTNSTKGVRRNRMCTGTHPYIPIPEACEIKMNFSTPGGVAQNVFNFQKDGGFSLTDLSTLAGGMSDWWQAELIDGVSDLVTLESVIATDISSESGSQVTFTDTLPAQGANTSHSLPMNSTAVISWRTDARGRSFRGRTYHVGLCDNAVAASALLAGTRLALIDAYTQLLGDTYFSSEYVLGIVSRCHDRAWRTTGLITPVVSIVVDLPLDSQRRRLIGRGA